MLIAPASATTIARLAHGMADDMVALTALATTAPVLVAPAMDAQMWAHAATQENVATLRDRGVIIVGPAEGRLASGHCWPRPARRDGDAARRGARGDGRERRSSPDGRSW